MNYAMRKLTASLQTLTRQSQQQRSASRPALPKAIQGGQFRATKGVNSFLEKRGDYAAKSQSVRVGSY